MGVGVFLLWMNLLFGDIIFVRVPRQKIQVVLVVDQLYVVPIMPLWPRGRTLKTLGW